MRTVLLIGAVAALWAISFSSACVAEKAVAIPAIAFMIMAVPSGLISNKIGRKNTQIVGLVGYAIGALVIYLFPDATMLNVGLLICGLTWPLANVVQVAMIVDSAPVETLMGTLSLIHISEPTRPY